MIKDDIHTVSQK